MVVFKVIKANDLVYLKDKALNEPILNCNSLITHDKLFKENKNLPA